MNSKFVTAIYFIIHFSKYFTDKYKLTRNIAVSIFITFYARDDYDLTSQ